MEVYMKIALITIGSILFLVAVGIIIMVCGVARMERRREENEGRRESKFDEDQA
jgi:uncharacterized membrane protein